MNEAVKIVKLGHYKKNREKPEAYSHPDFDYLARRERNRIERETIEALLKTCI